MVIRIRLARFGRTNAPLYNIVVAHARTARNSRPLEVLGTYDPIPKKDAYDTSGQLHKDVRVDIARAQYWIGVGAQPSDTVWRLLSMINVLPKKEFGKPNPTAAAALRAMKEWQDVAAAEEAQRAAAGEAA
jgi:small subunit ribosomal protein S16